MKINTVLYFMLLHTTFGFYISSLDEKKVSTNVVKIEKDNQMMLNRTNTLKNSKVHKKQDEAYNPKSYKHNSDNDVNLNNKYGLNAKYFSQHLDIKQSKNVLKNGNSVKNLSHRRRKIEETMDSDLSSENINGFFNDFYQRQGIEKYDFNSGNDDYDDDYRHVESNNNSNMSPDYLYENLYDDEEDTSLSEKSRKNLEYGSFQDLILQAKYNQMGQKSEEMKLQSIGSESFA